MLSFRKTVTSKLVVFFVCYAFTFALLDSHGSSFHPNTEAVGNVDLGKALLDKFVEQEIELRNLLNEQKSQKQNINVLTHEVSSLQDENKQTKDQITSQNQTIKTLQDENRLMKNQLILLNSTCSCSPGKQYDGNSTRIEDLRKEYQYLALSILDMQEKIKDNLNKTEKGLRQLFLSTRKDQANMSAAIANLQKWKNDTKVKVSFTAGITGIVSSISNGQTLIFNKEITNIGGGYNPYTGVFTSPKNGIFVFHSSTYGAKERRIDIVMNGNSVVEFYSYDNKAVETSSALVVLRLHTGDKVWVRHKQGTGYYTETPPWNTFSGFML